MIEEKIEDNLPIIICIIIWVIIIIFLIFTC